MIVQAVDALLSRSLASIIALCCWSSTVDWLEPRSWPKLARFETKERMLMQENLWMYQVHAQGSLLHAMKGPG